MKVTKQQLKALIKECLVEILVEGIEKSHADVVAEAAERSRTVSQRPRQSQQQPRGLQPRPALHAAVNEVAGHDNTLRGILTDTVVTTMPAQYAAEGPMAMSGAAALVESTDSATPVEDGNSAWADMAFNTSRPDPTKILALGFNPSSQA